MLNAQNSAEKPINATNQAAHSAQQTGSIAGHDLLPLNPYRGPLAFKTGERLYGRDKELNQLTNLVIAERIVLLHSPSGAGKTSLIQASLIPRLTTLRFRVLPIIRVKQEPVDSQGQKIDCNRYCFSTLLSLDQEYSQADQLPRDQLAHTTLIDYLAMRQGPENTAAMVLIFDQFEEILTLDPTDQVAKEEFFRQVGEVLESPRRWALFSMREDYVAALSPYTILIPGRLNTTFRLDLLDSNAARPAIIQPALQAGVLFDELAANKVIDDLRRVSIQRSDGSLEISLGPSIEPVQLQIVCHNLWETKRPDPSKITLQDLTDFGNVDESLGDYYAVTVTGVTSSEGLTGVSERGIREWFDRQLITEQGVRGSVLMGTEKSGGLANHAIQLLVDAYLVRSEKRSGITWFELSHDRLIAPIRANNAAWFKANLNVLQQQADLWDRQGRSENLLMRGDDLEDALRWVEGPEVQLLPSESDFISASKKLDSRVRRLKHRNRIIYALAVFSFILTLLTLFAYRQAIQQRLLAQEQARAAFSGQLAAQAEAALQDFPVRGILLALEAVKQSPAQPAAEEALRAALEDPHGRVLAGHQDALRTLAFSPDGRWLATGSDDNTVRLWNMSADPAASPKILTGHAASITKLVFSADGHWLATASADQTVRLWNMRASDPSDHPIVLTGHQSDVVSIAFSPDNTRLAAGSLDSRILLWDLTSTSPAAHPFSLTAFDSVWDLAFSPDSTILASTSGQDAQLWYVRQPDPSFHPLTLSGHQGIITTLAFSPDGHWLATGSHDNTVRLWNLQTDLSATAPQVFSDASDPVNTLAFSPDNHWLAAGSQDQITRVYNLTASNPALNPFVLRGHTGAINALAFSPNAHWLATGSVDQTARLWDLTASDPSAAVITLRGHEGSVNSLAFRFDGHLLATASDDHTARLWNVNSPDPAANPVIISDIHDTATQVAYSPNGSWFAAASGDLGTSSRPFAIFLWDTHAAGWDNLTPPLETAPTIPVQLQGNKSWVKTFAISSDGHYLAAAGGSGLVHVWNLQQSNPNAAAPLILTGHQDFVWSLAFSPKGDWLVSGSQDKTARLWNLQSPDPAAHPFVFNHEDRVSQVAFSSDGHWLATSSGNQAFLWNLLAPDPTKQSIQLIGHTDLISALAFSPDNHWLVTASSDTTARLWDLHASNSTANPMILRGHTDWITAAAFSADSAWLATASRDKSVRLWDLTGANPAAKSFQLVGHNAAVTGLAFSQHDQLLATGSDDGAVRLWNLAASDPSTHSVELKDQSKPVSALAFSPNGRWLSVATQDHLIRMWLVPMDELLAAACKSAGRNLTQEEWRQYFPGQAYHRTCEQWPSPSLR